MTVVTGAMQDRRDIVRHARVRLDCLRRVDSAVVFLGPHDLSQDEPENRQRSNDLQELSHEPWMAAGREPFRIACHDGDLEPLPIDAIVEDITDAVAQRGGVIIQSAPGSGKTTRIPPALLRFGGEVLALEPRRIAARMAARRVAFELGDELGGIVGYQVRFEQTAGPRTRLRYITEGILIRRMLADPQLRGVDCVVLDEFHERRIETDLALALLIRLRASSRPDLKIVIMSATLDTAPVARLLDAPVFESEGRLYDLAIEFTSYSAAPLEQQVAAAVERAPGDGHILAFLPGAAEIRNAARACEPVCARRGIRMHMLHGDLPAGEQ